MVEIKDIQVNQSCFHCGDALLSSDYRYDDHDFCCLGCQTVYQILHDNNLKSYYRYNQHPGKSNKGEIANLAYLDEPVIADKLIDFKGEQITIVTFYIPVIHCSSCIWLLENLYKINPNVLSSQVDFMKKQASITFKHQDLSLRNLVALLISIGYEPKVTLQDIVKEGKKANSNPLIAKIAVAGFCFGNSMMLSFPEYFGLAAFEKSYSLFFGYANLLFAIPVLCYSASDYFKSAFLSIRQKRLNLDVPLALGIFILFVRTAYDVITQSGAGFADTLCSLVFFILIGKWIQEKTYHHISFERDYRSYFPVAVTTIVDGKEKAIQLADLQVGDRILVRNNEIIPADALLLNGEACIDFSFVTGESKPVAKTLGEVIYAGGRQTAKAIELEVVKSVSQSYLTRLWNNENYKHYDKPFQTFIGYISKYFTIVLLLIAVSATVFWMIDQDGNKAWGAFTAVLIIACPCALALSSPFTLAAALSVFDRNKFYAKNAATVEQMATVDTVVFDKTGTISSPMVNGIAFEGFLTAEEKRLVYSSCRNSSHPLSREIVKWMEDIDAVPVNSYQESVGEGSVTHIGRAIVKIGSARFVGASKTIGEESHVFVSINGEVKGCFSMEQSWRPGLSGVIHNLKKYDLHLISGDNDHKKDVLKNLFPPTAQLMFNQSPLNKLEIINLIQENGRHICMLGDGLNDAGALKAAALGIAVSDDINNFSPGCDAILDGASFEKLPQFFDFSKDVVRVIHLSFGISLFYNVIGLSFAVQGEMSPLFAAILMPISTVTIISFTSLLTHWYAKRRGL